VKNIDIRRFLGYVCQIAKVRVRMSFGWVSLFTQKGGCYGTVMSSANFFHDVIFLLERII